MIKIQLNEETMQQIRNGEGPIELVDGAGLTVGTVRRPPTGEEISRAKSRASRGGSTLTWDQLMDKVRAETGH